MKSYGEYWRQARRKRNMTQLELSELLGWESAQFISNVERGLAHYPLMTLPKLIHLLGLPFEEVIDLIMRKEEKELRKYLRKKKLWV